MSPDAESVVASEPSKDASTYVPLSDDPVTTRAARFVRALVVGACATGSDLVMFTIVHRVLHVSPEWARAPALATGALVQFVGNRVFTFRATAGDVKRHARLFFTYELGAYLANIVIFRYLVKWITIVPPEIVTFLGTFLVFALYSYPVRRLVIFRLLKDEETRRREGRA
ncbi:MAG: GtrA family protein [Myxococcales bacterium]|nr:GtrA family protein [Myxococcales bacterium]